MRSVAGLCAVAAAFGVIGTVNAQTKRAAQTLRFHSSSPIPKPSSALGGDADIQRDFMSIPRQSCYRHVGPAQAIKVQ